MNDKPSGKFQFVSWFVLPALRRVWTHIIFGVGLLLVDLLTGPYLILPVLFVFPVGLSAWFYSARLGYALALFLPLCRLFIVTNDGASVPFSYAVGNAIIRAGLLLAVGFFTGLASRQNKTLRQRLDSLTKRYRLLFETMHQGVVLQDASGKIFSANANAEKILGRTLVELQGQTSEDLEHQTMREDGSPFPRLKHPSMVALRTGKVVSNIRMRIFNPRLNSYRWIEITAVPVFLEVGDPAPSEVYAVFEDITDRIQAERDYLLLAEAIEQAAEVVLITDTNGAIQYVNPAFEKCTGFKRSEIIGRNPRILKSGKHDAEFYRQMWDTLKMGDVWHGRITNKRKDGTLFIEEGCISPIRDKEGVVMNYVAVKHDITREMQLEQQFMEVQRMEAIGQLAGGVAHDYNNILAANIMQLEMLLIMPGLSQELKLGLENLLGGEQRAAKLTSQLLMFSRCKKTQKQAVDLNELLEDEIKMLRRLLGEHLELTTTTESKNAWIEADSGMIEQVIMNLCINARDAMPEGGRLTITVSQMELNAAEALANTEARPGRFICLSVADTGCGMSMETRQRIFEPFFTTKEVGKGTGLGLASVYGIVKEHKGWIEVSSEPGKGSEFRVMFPAIPARSPKLAPATPPKMDRGTETILVVEDEPTVRDMTVMCLKANGYQVHVAANGPEALQKWGEHTDQIHLLLTDVIMPGGITGFALAEAFKKLKPSLPVILMSGYSNDITNSGILAHKRISYLSKPCGVRELTSAVRKSLLAAIEPV